MAARKPELDERTTEREEAKADGFGRVRGMMDCLDRRLCVGFATVTAGEVLGTFVTTNVSF